MKTLTNYIINESSSNWMEKKLNELQSTNTENKLKTITVLYGIYLAGPYIREIRDGYGELWDEKNVKENIRKAYINSAIDINVVTTKKGNFYGITKNNITNKPELAKLFNKRVTGTKGFIWTNDIKNIKIYLENMVKYKKVDQEFSGYGDSIYQIYNLYFSSQELARDAANKLSKYHDMKVITAWHGEKIKELQNKIKQREENIKSAEEDIARWKEEINDIKSDITEYETLKNLSSTDLNESLTA